jgi:hypothetical protein
LSRVDAFAWPFCELAFWLTHGLIWSVVSFDQSHPQTTAPVWDGGNIWLTFALSPAAWWRIFASSKGMWTQLAVADRAIGHAPNTQPA